MKKVGLLLTCFCLLTFLAGSVNAQEPEVTVAPTVETVAPTATIFAVQGEAQVYSQATGEWKAAEKGMPLNVNDKIRTMPASTVEIFIGKPEDKNILKIDADTTAKLESSDGKKIDVINLSMGKIFSLMSNLEPGAKFEVRTPTSVAGARGTGWGVNSGGNQDIISAFLNSIYVYSLDETGSPLGELTLDAGLKVLVDRFKTPGKPGNNTPEESAEWGDWVNQVTEKLNSYMKEDKPVAEPYEEPGFSAGDFVVDEGTDYGASKDNIAEGDGAGDGSTTGAGAGGVSPDVHIQHKPFEKPPNDENEASAGDSAQSALADVIKDTEDTREILELAAQAAEEKIEALEERTALMADVAEQKELQIDQSLDTRDR